jgi:hypothetical protein
MLLDSADLAYTAFDSSHLPYAYPRCSNGPTLLPVTLPAIQPDRIEAITIVFAYFTQSAFLDGTIIPPPQRIDVSNPFIGARVRWRVSHRRLFVETPA